MIDVFVFRGKLRINEEYFKGLLCYSELKSLERIIYIRD